MVHDISTAWLYAYSNKPSHTSRARHTVFMRGEGPNGRNIMAQTCLSYLTTLSENGAGTWIASVTPPFGPPEEFSDFKFNSVFSQNAIAVTFALNAVGAEAHSLGTIFYFS
jgi:hypothetical protein